MRVPLSLSRSLSGPRVPRARYDVTAVKTWDASFGRLAGRMGVVIDTGHRRGRRKASARDPRALNARVIVRVRSRELMAPRVRAVGIFRRPFSTQRAAMGVQVNARQRGRLGDSVSPGLACRPRRNKSARSKGSVSFRTRRITRDLVESGNERGRLRSSAFLSRSSPGPAVGRPRKRTSKKGGKLGPARPETALGFL